MLTGKDFQKISRTQLLLGLLFLALPMTFFADTIPIKIVVNNSLPYEGHIIKYFQNGQEAACPQGANIIAPAIYIAPNYKPSQTQFTENYTGPGDSLYFYSFYDQNQNSLGSCTFMIHNNQTTLGSTCSGIKLDSASILDGGSVGVVFSLKSLTELNKNKKQA